MRVATICFAAGVGLAQWQPQLPGWEFLAALCVVCLILLVLGRLLRHGVTPAARVSLALGCALLGFAFGAARGQLRLADELPSSNEGRDIQVVGIVAGLPQDYDRGQRFDFQVEQADAEIPRRISLAWYGSQRPQHGDSADAADDAEPALLRVVRAGERWQLTVRLKRPHGNLNPHGFDYEAWLFERGLRATGYVRQRPEPQRLAAFVLRPDTVVERMRERVRDAFRAALPQGEYAGILIALAVGDQRAVDARQWQLLARTGITHLMSISGLHVTMIAGLMYALAGALWRRVPLLALRLPAQQAGIAAGWLAAGGYTLLSGFGVPAQRTFYMLSVVVLALWLRRTTATSRVLLLALLLVLLLDPWAVVAPGFWLSFGAVAVLFYVAGGDIRQRHWLRTWLRAQWAVTLGLVPALLALFQQFSLVSPLANAVAIPVVSLVVTPLALLAAVIPLTPLLELAHWLLAVLMAGLEWLGALPAAVWQQAAPPSWTVVLALAGCAWMLLPPAFPSRWAGAVLLLPLFGTPAPRPAAGELHLTVLDVGQGLAVHAQTAGHDLIYDTGPQFSAEADSGERIIVPYLRAQGVRGLDGLIVTHADRDHAGGAASLLAALPVAWFASSLPDSDPLRAAPLPQLRCEAGQSWEWDGVRFEILHPQPGDYAAARNSNDLSCVLRVVAAGGSVLLGADMSAAIEARLLAQGAAVRAEHFVVPHHGSRSSSTAEFVTAVGARQAIFAVGYRSRFGHPHPEVLARYAAAGADILRTDRDGALQLQVAPQATRIRREREESRRYWHGR